MSKQTLLAFLRGTVVCLVALSFEVLVTPVSYAQPVGQTPTPEPQAEQPAVRQPPMGQLKEGKRGSLGLKKLYLTRDKESKSQKLEIDVVPEARCTLGDLDAMLLDFRRAQGKIRLQVSLEPLVAAASEGAYSDSPVEKSGRGVLGKFSLNVPYYERPVLMGLFLCSAFIDDNLPNTKLCSDKALLSFNEIMKPHRVDPSKIIGPKGKAQPAPMMSRTTQAPRSKIYFFRFLILVRDHILVPSVPMNSERYASLMSYLASLDADVTDYDALKAEVEKFATKTTSTPLKVKSNHLEIILPYYSRKKCMG